MIYSILRYIWVVVGLCLLSGCAQKNITLPEQFWQEKPKIVIAHCKAPEPGMTVSGQQGLLDMAITGIANNKIISRLKRTDLSWYPNFSQQFAQQLKKRSIDSIIEDAPMKNEKTLLARAQGNKLLIIKLQAIGIRREYSLGFVSGGAPKAYCVLSGELIEPCNPKNPLWHSEVEIMQPIPEPWDQSPEFPNLMEALNQTTEAARTELLDSFFSGH